MSTPEQHEEKIRIGISRCLLGENVRYDGGHKLDRYIRDTLGKYFDYVGVCPEVECGMTTPMEALRLVGDPDAPRLMTQKTKKDYTDQMQDWGRRRLDGLEPEELCGYIFKAKSPSSGMTRIKVYQENGSPVNTGVGIWARMFMDRFPLLPAEDDGRLHDPRIRENFIERVFVFKRFRDMIKQGKNTGNLVEFHTRHKLLIRAHSEEIYREMGKLVAEAKGKKDIFEEYLELLTKAMALQATTKKHRNVLMHIMGHFKKFLTSDEKQELLEVIDHYADGLVPLIVPMTLINHFVRKYDEQYLKGQYYLNPHPIELKLRNYI